MPRVTLQTIADALGVSRSTVSNAYNKPDQLTQELRERILAEATKLGYAGPDAAARSLRSGKTGAIGLLFTESLPYAFSDPYAVGFLTGLAEVAERHGTSLLLVPVDTGLGGTPEADLERAVRQAVVDGFCLYCVDESHPAVDIIRARGLPMVATYPPKDPHLRSVGIDDEAAAFKAGEHLARLGHERIGVVMDRWFGIRPFPPLDLEGPTPIQQVIDLAPGEESTFRLRGYRKALPDADIMVTTAERNSRAAGAVAVEELIDQRCRSTAILAVSDVIAFGVIDALRQRGLTPGQDLSVVGFDDVPQAAEFGLTTIRQPMVDRGRMVGRMLLEPDTIAERQVRLPTELVVRTSTGPRPS
ncbi:LacI family DNA-binding transcriptional regulator [Tenggerimyces flavus]|uniref:LacI family DNA-binding transcriptional regulator n=1 Tax=Tenggerimyces flavus TaxID=1708749 RepID=A0ABV7YN37_9ACTN|nr:LacI family DNA-binding transcriptional regulator [Tenggerimyces flavus]MBM7790449.1 DNA-binding LacI/PurR family transcriptional regulator [Tenggerimyces flavus]